MLKNAMVEYQRLCLVIHHLGAMATWGIWSPKSLAQLIWTMFCVAERQGFEEGESAAGLLHPLTLSATHSRDWRDLQLRHDSLHSWEHTGCHLPASASPHHVASATQNLARLVWALQPRRCVPWPMINQGLNLSPISSHPCTFCDYDRFTTVRESSMSHP
jgi:hypothetical protein